MEEERAKMVTTGQSQPAKTTGVVTKEQKRHEESVMACVSAQSSLPFQCLCSPPQLPDASHTSGQIFASSGHGCCYHHGWYSISQITALGKTFREGWAANAFLRLAGPCQVRSQVLSSWVRLRDKCQPSPWAVISKVPVAHLDGYASGASLSLANSSPSRQLIDIL